VNTAARVNTIIITNDYAVTVTRPITSY